MSAIESISAVHQLTAKMLAVENINVKFVNKLPRDAPAAFDVVSRNLYLLPVVKEQEHVYAGLIIHECGHAIFTNPVAGEIKDKPITRLFNAIEDGYQERAMLKKYPGVKKHLFNVFDEFFLKDFDIKHYTTPDKILNVINIITYNCKGLKYGKVLDYPTWLKSEHVKFIKNEIELLSDKEYSARYKKYLELLKILNQYQKFVDSPDDQPGDNSEVSDGEATPDTGGAGKDKSPSDGDSQAGEGEGKGASSSQKNENDIANDFKKYEDNITEDFVDHHEKVEYISDNSNPLDYNGSIAKYEENFIVSEINSKELKTVLCSVDENNLQIARNAIKNCRKNAQLIYSHFISKKNAINVAKVTDHKTGCVDPLLMHSYKWNDNIFEKKQTITEQENHAYVVALDWSSSMADSVHRLFPKICELVLFAELANVKLKVVLFTTTQDYTYKIKAVMHNIIDTHEHVGLELKRRLEYLNILCRRGKAFARSGVAATRDKKRIYHDMFGTSIFEAILYSHELLYNMSETNKTLIMLNDGQDSEITTPIKYNGFIIPKYEGMTNKNSCSKFINEYYRSYFGHKNICISWDIPREYRGINKYIFEVEYDCNETPDNIFIRELIKQLI